MYYILFTMKYADRDIVFLLSALYFLKIMNYTNKDLIFLLSASP